MQLKGDTSLTEQNVQEQAKAEVEKTLHCDDLSQDQPRIPDAGTVEHGPCFAFVPGPGWLLLRLWLLCSSPTV